MNVVTDRDGADGRLSDIVVKAGDVLQRRWKTLAAIAVLVLVATAALIHTMTPTYRAESQVRIDPSRDPLAKSGGQKDDTLSPESIETEVSIITSHDQALKVIKKLHLENDPELAGASHRQGGETRESQLANALLSRVNVGREKLTYLIGITAHSTDPVKAAQIANGFADAYLESKVNSASGSAQTQAQWLKARLDRLQDEVRVADTTVARFRAEAGVTGTGNGQNGGVTTTIADERVGPLSSQLATAQAEAASAHAQLTAAQGQVAGGGLDAVSEVRSSPVVADLRRQRAELLRNIGEIQARYGDKHPESLRVRGQLETVDRQIREEGSRVLGSLRANAAAADAQVAALRGSMTALEAERSRQMQAAVQADSLDREAAAKRNEYERLSQMLLESTQAAQNSIAQAEIVSRAQVPTSPASPNKPLLLAMGLFLGLAAGVAVIVTQEVMTSTLRTASDVEELLGLPLLAAVPKVAHVGNSPADLITAKPTSIFSESFRIIRAAISARRGEKPPFKVIALTSALPSEGKTTSALAFARSLAVGDARTILVECDVRRAALNRALGVDQGTQPGIVEALHGEVGITDVIRPSGIANLDHILVREPYFSSEDLFGGRNMTELLNYLRARYDQVVLDLPPLVGLADGRALATMADAVLLVVKWDATPSRAAEMAGNWLQSDGANPVGVLLTSVSQSSQAMGSYYYSKQYSKYYQSA